MHATIYGDRYCGNDITVRFYLECKADEYGIPVYSIPMGEVKQFIKAMEMIGKKVTDIKPDRMLFVDMDTKYYNSKKLSGITNSLYNRLWRGYSQPSFFIKNNRFYVHEDGMDIILPKDMHDLMEDYKQIHLKFTIE